MRRALSTSLLRVGLALATGCACGALSHGPSPASDAGSRDAAAPADVPPDVPLCWARCSREGSRIEGIARIDGVDVPVSHALVSTSSWFAVYAFVSLVAEDCDSAPSAVMTLEFDPLEWPHVGHNVVRVHTSAGEVGAGSIDVTAWEPQSTTTGPSGRLAGRLLVELSTVALDVTVDVSLCEDESRI